MVYILVVRETRHGQLPLRFLKQSYALAAARRFGYIKWGLAILILVKDLKGEQLAVCIQQVL